MQHTKKRIQPNPVTYRTIAPASAPIPTFDDLPPVPPIPTASETEEPVLDPDKKGQQMIAGATQRRADALREWGEILPTLAELDQHIADMHEIRKAILDGLSESARNVARTEWCKNQNSAYQLQGTGVLARISIVELPESTDINEEIMDLEKEYM